MIRPLVGALALALLLSASASARLPEVRWTNDGRYVALPADAGRAAHTARRERLRQAGHHRRGHHRAARAERRSFASGGNDPRPHAWCMWWLRRELGIPKSAFRPDEYNLARAGRYIGEPAHGPAVGAIVVWRHHIGIITGRSGRGWIVKSGNDGHAVRERPRSLAGAIAFRWWPQGTASR